jgi:hypothetical protein
MMTNNGDDGETTPTTAGDVRAADRRRGDRRRESRRGALPVWRRPAALVAYGVVGALVLVMILQGLGRDDVEDGSAIAREIEIAEAAREQPIAAGAGNYPATREAYTLAQYERLLAEGDAAVGEIVRTELFCGSINPVTVRDSERANRGLIQLADAQGRVGGAECRWSSEARSSDFLLIVPSDLAEDFARSPEVEMNFVRRRRIPANVEWLGRSEELALRNAGVLRQVVRVAS